MRAPCRKGLFVFLGAWGPTRELLHTLHGVGAGQEPGREHMGAQQPHGWVLDETRAPSHWVDAQLRQTQAARDRIIFRADLRQLPLREVIHAQGRLVGSVVVVAPGRRGLLLDGTQQPIRQAGP